MGWRVGSAFDRAATVFPPLTNGVTTISLRGLDAKVLREVKLENGAYSWQKDYIYREGQLLASHGHNEPLQHYHLDHLGTPRMLSNRCGERLQRFESFPFGEAIAELPQHPEKMRLTGHQRDLSQPSTTEDDLDYMHARYYGTLAARFLSIDPGLETKKAIRRPQSWNRYSYVVGSPLMLVDPTGAYVEVVGEENQRVFFDAVTGSMAPGAAKYLKWQNNRLVIVGISAHSFWKMYGLVAYQLAHLISSPQAFRVEIGASRNAALGGGGHFCPKTNTISVDPARFPRMIVGIEVSFPEILVHEMAHAVGTLIPGLEERFVKYVRGVYPLKEAYAIAVQNEYRRSVLGLSKRNIRLGYWVAGDFDAPGPEVPVFPGVQ